MLSAQHQAIVRATVPLLETGGEALTRHFYARLLRDHPEVRPLFNQAHQHSGSQQRALANGVLMYAKNIDRLEALGDLVGVIVAKHVSLQIQPEHYPIVGACLLAAIREVLGAELATDAVLEAWGAAYGQLANILIGAEKAAYDQTAAQPGGWRGGRSFTVVERRMESAEILSLRLQPADGGAVVRHQPGQFIGLRLTVDGQEVRRNYSLSAAADGRSLRISVKREPGGTVSGHLHSAVRVGDALEVFAPAGSFVLRDGDRPLVFVSGGVGITPVMAMLQAAVADGRRRPVTFIHAARRAEVHAFREATDALVQAHPQVARFYCYEEPAQARGAGRPDAVGRLTAELLRAWLPASRDVDAYFLGPLPFMKAVKAQLASLGIPPAQTHWEFFGPAKALD